eukprot:8118657-Pyramimonas_sp.AAC.1
MGRGLQSARALMVPRRRTHGRRGKRAVDCPPAGAGRARLQECPPPRGVRRAPSAREAADAADEHVVA